MDPVAMRIPIRSLDVDPSNNPDQLLRMNRIENLVELAIVDILKYHSNFSRAVRRSNCIQTITNRCSVAGSCKKSREK